MKQGYTAIEQFVEDREFENLHIDFKRSSDGGQSRKLTQSDRQNLAKEISGFGNSEGGVVVWGIDCSDDEDGADVAHEETMINNPLRYASLLEGAISGCTIPPHKDIKNHVVETNNDKGFVVTLIPSSDAAPHRTIYNHLYYIRAGSNFHPAPHEFLAGMFGRRPQPDLRHKWVVGVPEIATDSLKIGIGLLIYNYGRGIAIDIYCTVISTNLPGTRCRIEFEPRDQGQTNWKDRFGFGFHFSTISAWNYRLPPDCFDQPVVLQLYLTPPFEGSLSLNGTVGSGTSGKFQFKIDQDASSIEMIYSRIIKRLKTDSPDDPDFTDLISELHGIES